MGSEYDFMSLENLSKLDYGSVIDTFNVTWEASTYKTVNGKPFNTSNAGFTKIDESLYDNHGRCVWNPDVGLTGPAVEFNW